MDEPQTDMDMESAFADTDTLLGAREWIRECLTDAGADDGECDDVDGNFASMVFIINGLPFAVSLSLIEEEVEH
jgi:hypothetical protein